MALADSLTQGITQIKSTLKNGGLLRPVEWLRRTGEVDVRGRQDVSVTLLDVFIESEVSLDRATIDTDRADRIKLLILEPVAVKDTDLFRWGDHSHKVESVTGVLENESTGVRFSSEVVLIR